MSMHTRTRTQRTSPSERKLAMIAGTRSGFISYEIKPDHEAIRRERRAALAEQAGRRLFGRSVDTTGDLFDQNRAPAPLFAAPTPRATVIA